MANDNFDLPRPTDAVPSAASTVLNDNSKVLDYVINGEGTVENRVGDELLTLDEAIARINWDYVGLFSDGVTFTAKTDFAVDAVGTQWVYNGPYPFTATAGTVPSAPDYQVVHVKSHALLSQFDSAGGHDSIYSREFDSVADVIAFGECVDGSRICVNGNLWDVNTTSGVDIGGGLFLLPVAESAPVNFLDLTDTATSEPYRAALTGRLMPLSDAFRDIMNRSYTGAAPFVTCYGDSNTRYFNGDTSSSGPYSKSYGSYIDVYAAEYPALYQSTVEIKGFPGEDSDFGITNFDTEVDSNSNFVILGFGTNNVSRTNANLDVYISEIVTLFEKCLAINAMPIMLGIPWFSSTYGNENQLSQDRLKTWNATLYALCTECNVPFIDTYNLTRSFPDVYFNENTLKRHYSPEATKQIAQKAIEILKVAMRSAGDMLGYTQKTWGNSEHVLSAGNVSRASYNSGGMRFETLKIPQGQSVSFGGMGRGCISFYPRAVSTVNINNGTENIDLSIVPAIDNGEYYSVIRQALGYANFGARYTVTITAMVGDAYLRSVSFEDGANVEDVFSQSYQEVLAADLPTVGVVGRTYFIEDLQVIATWYSASSAYLSASGLLVTGTTSTRDAVAAVGAPNGYKFYNTTTAQGERYDLDLNTWSAI